MSIWNDIEKIRKEKSIAQIGGFKPSDEIISWFGGNFLGTINSDWPEDNDGNMVPVLQIYIPELTCDTDVFGEVELVQVFLNKRTLPTNTEVANGNGWFLKEYKNISELQVIETPKDVRKYKPFQIRWQTSETFDYPTWEESWDYIDMSIINNSEEMTSKYFDEYESENRTKVGGFASYIQSPPITENKFIFQISSNEKTKFYVGDSGNIYIYKNDKTKEWFLHWDCY